MAFEGTAAGLSFQNIIDWKVKPQKQAKFISAEQHLWAQGTMAWSLVASLLESNRLCIHVRSQEARVSKLASKTTKVWQALYLSIKSPEDFLSTKIFNPLWPWCWTNDHLCQLQSAGEAMQSQDLIRCKAISNTAMTWHPMPSLSLNHRLLVDFLWRCVGLMLWLPDGGR